MNEQQGETPEWLELAMLPTDDPRRQAFERAIGAEAPALRERWEKETALTDALHAALPNVQVPAGLEAKLLKIATAQPAVMPVGAARQWAGWKVAAVVMVAVGLIAAVVMFESGGKEAGIDSKLSHTIAAEAVKHQTGPVDVASADVEVVRKKLESYGFDFPVLMLTPLEGVKLVGGGQSDIGGARAVYTRWEASGFHYTLYEFNGKDIGASPTFSSVKESPQELWRGDDRYQVVVFPGSEGKCCWALVMDRQEAPNVFARYMTGNY